MASTSTYGIPAAPQPLIFLRFVFCILAVKVVFDDTSELFMSLIEKTPVANCALAKPLNSRQHERLKICKILKFCIHAIRDVVFPKLLFCLNSDLM